jgi:hypothetical protein
MYTSDEFNQQIHRVAVSLPYTHTQLNKGVCDDLKTNCNTGIYHQMGGDKRFSD